jgi:hypothetical protein
MNNISDVVVKPGTILQQNFHKTQDYAQVDQLTYLTNSFEKGFLKRHVFEYLPFEKSNQAALNFNISTREKMDIEQSAKSKTNAQILRKILD